jgi:hypothetical protein
MLKTFACIAAATALAALGACSDDSAEKAGEEIDSAIEKATGGGEDKGDGPFEKAGEAIDKATSNQNTDIGDSISDATDGDRSTKPN